VEEQETRRIEFFDLATAIQNGGSGGGRQHFTQCRTYIYAADFQRGNVVVDGVTFTSHRSFRHLL
jgi:hypothetical protein